MSSSFVIACVGKPSAGKSSFLNAVTDASAKVGNFPFTTIEPNQGIAYYPVDCPCARGSSGSSSSNSNCKPRYGWCVDGRRFVPVRLLDVAGLVPGASTGRGLGNKFLDDLRNADVLIHVVDASGTTDDNGRTTKGYDPVDDIQWLRKEIEDWVFGNIDRRWPGIVRRHVAVKASVVDTLHAQLAGYGTVRSIVQRAVDQMHALHGSMDLAKWDLDRLRVFVGLFLDERFPTVVALNKIDMPDADKNIAAIMRRYRGPDPRDGVRPENIVLTSALSECFLRKMAKQNFITYTTGDSEFGSDAPGLRPQDERTQRRLETISDLVLFRYGSTGVQDVIVRAVEVRGFVPVFPVKSFSAAAAAFPECLLVRPGTTVREFARRLHSDIDREYAGAETIGGIQLAEDDVIAAGKNNVIKFL
ncbi:hypothetical protein LPJ59_001851 [Coemansia sp. RSA 2399]|nr:hypothetical protein LPJ59_001851 [Coemansia sp. RSA 2399]KAJ1905025.1 hypothetical protein LPJ81_002153 [Coemansia sp. IMI 209127]